VSWIGERGVQGTPVRVLHDFRPGSGVERDVGLRAPFRSGVFHDFRPYGPALSCLGLSNTRRGERPPLGREAAPLARCSPPTALTTPGPACCARGETTRCSLRRVSAMGTPLVQLSHPARLWGAESGTA
jgi:hypothetical protein